MAVLQTKHATLILLLLVACVLGLASAGTNEAGLAFLEENRGKPGVVELPSGLQYKVLRRGRGTAHPTSGSPCSCHYEGTLIDGTVFDSSYERGEPASFAPNQVIKGWTEAMQMMVAGDKVRVAMNSWRWVSSFALCRLELGEVLWVRLCSLFVCWIAGLLTLALPHNVSHQPPRLFYSVSGKCTFRANWPTAIAEAPQTSVRERR